MQTQTAKNDLSEYLTAQAAAEKTGIPVMTLKLMKKAGILPYYQNPDIIGFKSAKFKVSDIHEAVKGMKRLDKPNDGYVLTKVEHKGGHAKAEDIKKAVREGKY